MCIMQRLALTTMLLVLFAQASFAQVQPCGQCAGQSAPWTYGGWIQFPISCSPGCTAYFEAQYYYRNNCTLGTVTYQDLSITGLRPVLNNGDYCNLCDQGTLMREAIRRLIGNNPMGFAPTDADPDGTCYTNWRVSTGGCWYSYLPISMPVEYGPCNENCCRTMFRICKVNGRRVIDSRIDGQGGGTSECSTPPVSGYGGACRPMCPELDDRLLGPTPKGTQKRMVDEATPELFNSTVFPNPASNSVTIAVTASRPEASVVVLADDRGAEVARSAFPAVTSEHAEYVIDITPLANGHYFYRVLQHDRAIATGSFVVSR